MNKDSWETRADVAQLRSHEMGLGNVFSEGRNLRGGDLWELKLKSRAAEAGLRSWASSRREGEPRGAASWGAEGYEAGQEAGRLGGCSYPAPLLPSQLPATGSYRPTPPSRPLSHQLGQTSRGNWETAVWRKGGCRGHPFLPLSHWILLSVHLPSLSHA